MQSFFDPTLTQQNDLEWLFILTFPNGGSTALARLLLSAPHVISLTDNAEGQWLVPQMSKPRLRWDPSNRIRYRVMKAVWLKRIKELGYSDRSLVVEKSPSNLCRYKRLLSELAQMKTYVVTFSRDPYATISSWHARYGIKNISRDWGARGLTVGSSERSIFHFYTEIWLKQARMLLEAKQYEAVAHLSYESFCDDTEAMIKHLQGSVPLLAGVNVKGLVEVKDYDPQPIKNMNPQQIGLLSNSQVSAIGEVLKSDLVTVTSLGYGVL